MDEKLIKRMINSYEAWNSCFGTQQGYGKLNYSKSRTKCEKKVLEALRAMQTTKAREILEFIESNPYNFSQEDLGVEEKIFKLVKTKEEFEALQRTNRYHENLVESDEIEMLFVEMPDIDLFRQKGILREWNSVRKYYEKNSDNYGFSKLYRAFKFWHNVNETGIYYIYIH